MISNHRQQPELTEKTTDNAYLLKAKLQEKDDALTTLSDQVMKLMIEVQKTKGEVIPYLNCSQRKNKLKCVSKHFTKIPFSSRPKDCNSC